ncbi:type IV toxin-antitoxin system AbiEi family antitoxin domain-containing protein [Streptomyces sp. NBC_00287]|uniref:type IV toxin-antitoxin system AbiEi family antitoxin domain-containing protein n=1 Tax=Streptomyces sp. NBC_00287 TaxID=2975702 RepID=UPI002E2B56CB|nr:type IV toxin-antitoxin system AbiEi family antitoxin domain-containing protein [Streptomyces sp. NBC_00287]
MLGERASDQWGLVTAAQAKLDGLQGVQLLRLERSGLLENVGRGVYRVAAAVPPEHLEIKVAWLRLDPNTPAWQRSIGDPRSGVVSHASACELHGLGDLPADRVELSVPVRRTTRDEGVLLHRLPVDTEDITVVDGLPVTTAERTITDLLGSRADGAHVGTVIADADLKVLIDIDRLSARVTPFLRAYGLPATASGEDLLASLCDQAGRTLRRQETEQAVAVGFASAVTALETLAAQPNAVEQALKSMSRQQFALPSLGALQAGGLEQVLKNAAVQQAAWHSALAWPNALQQLLNAASAQQSALESLAVRPSALKRALEQMAAGQSALRSPAARPSALGQAFADYQQKAHKTLEEND